VDPRDGTSPLPIEIDAAEMIDQTAFDRGVLVTSSHSTPDGFAGEQTLLAPAYNTTDDDLEAMFERFASAVADVEDRVKELVV
jgi:hypothetical protein